MATGSTIYKAELGVADMDRGYYGSHMLTLARHPSETEERLMVRLLAFALDADPALTFGAGLSTDEQPDLWLRDDTGAIRLWIEVGLPDERLIRKACGRADQVRIWAYGGAKADAWWRQNAAALRRQERLRVMALDSAAVNALGRLARRSMRLDCSVQDGVVWLGCAQGGVSIEPATWWQSGVD